MERAWLAADALCPPFTIDLVVVGEGSLEPGAWREAARRVGEALPSTRAALRGRACRARWVDTGAPPAVRAVRAEAWHARSDRGGEAVRAPLDPARGCVEVVLVDAARPTVVVRVHHAAHDGRALVAIGRALAAAARGEAIAPEPPPWTDAGLAAHLGVAGAPLPRPRALAATGRHDGSALALRWGRRTVEGSWSAFLGRWAVAVAAHARRQGDGPVVVHVPVDLRRHLDGPAPLGNLTGIVALPVDEGDDAAAVVARLGEALGARAELAQVRGAAVLVHVPMAVIRAVGARAAAAHNAEGRVDATAILSNVGEVRLDELVVPGFTPREAFVLPPGGRATAAFGMATRVGGRTELAVTMPEGFASGGRLDALLDDVAAAFTVPAPPMC